MLRPRTAGNRGRPWEACGAGPREGEGAMRLVGVRAGGPRGGAAQRAYGRADGHALLFRSRRRAAGIARLATLNPLAARRLSSKCVARMCAGNSGHVIRPRPQLFFLFRSSL